MNFLTGKMLPCFFWKRAIKRWILKVIKKFFLYLFVWNLICKFSLFKAAEELWLQSVMRRDRERDKCLTHRVVALVRRLLSEVLEDLPVKVFSLQLSSCSWTSVQHPQSHLETLRDTRAETDDNRVYRHKTRNNKSSKYIAQNIHDTKRFTICAAFNSLHL